MQDAIAKKITDLASLERALSESEVSHLMTLCRTYLENIPHDRERNAILKFFCDWAFRISLDRSYPGLAMLRRINDTPVELPPVPENYRPVMNRFTAVVSFQQLRREMGEVFQRIGVPNSLDGDHGRWTNFIANLIEIIRDCPLEVGDERKMRRPFRDLYEVIEADPIKGYRC